MTNIGIIPARFASTRLPGKPLIRIGGKPLIQWVYQHAAEALDRVVVATDDTRVADAVEAFGGVAVLTGPHPNGTARVYEAYRLIGSDARIVVNIQGDEPLLPSDDIAMLAARCAHGAAIATLVHPTDAGNPALNDPNTVKAVLDDNGRALYFSRARIPYSDVNDDTVYHTHIGIYAYHADILEKITGLPSSPLSRTEKLEQLSWLQAGYEVRTFNTESVTIGIDTLDDCRRAEQILKKYD